MNAIGQEAYSYRGDNRVPRFDDRAPVVFMDGECALCTGAARIIARLDRRGEFRICPVQSALGQAMLQHYGLNSENPESWMYLAGGKAYVSLDAVIEAGAALGGPGRFLRAFSILPRPLGDWLYRRIARNRYALFGRAQMCSVSDPLLKQRLLT